MQNCIIIYFIMWPCICFIFCNDELYNLRFLNRGIILFILKKAFCYRVKELKLKMFLHYQEILQLLRTVFDLIIQFETAQGVFYSAATDEVVTRGDYERKKRERTAKVNL